jgi:NAD(P)H-hydrate epimerase
VQILSAKEIKAWDNYTILHQPIAFIDLMETAARKCVQWILNKRWTDKKFFIFCGKGNNGGDGLAIARMLIQAGLPVSAYILEFGKSGSEDFQVNLQRLHELALADIHFIQSTDNFPVVDKKGLIIDALFGSGLNNPLESLSADLVKHLNQSGATCISIDIPSGLFIDQSSAGNTIIHADYTLSFQCYKPGLLVQENAPFIGEIHILDIGLHPEYLHQLKASKELIDKVMVRKIFKPRKKFSHKGDFGHALIIGGSYGKIGAIILATKACLGSGAGLTTAFIPKCGYQIIQIASPEAMAIVDEEETHLATLPAEIEKFSAIGVGPGMGTKPETQKLISFIIRRYRKPIVIDADGLNCLALQQELLEQLPPYSILTPHPKEFDRLFGEHKTDFERIEKAKAKATTLKIIIVLKSHHTLIALPDGHLYFNSTGNAGMAKGGSGDVLTGMITSFLAQGYKPDDAAVLAVYLHGWAGDFAAKQFSKEAMLATHLILSLSKVFLSLQ